LENCALFQIVYNFCIEHHERVLSGAGPVPGSSQRRRTERADGL